MSRMNAGIGSIGLTVVVIVLSAIGCDSGKGTQTAAAPTAAPKAAATQAVRLEATFPPVPTQATAPSAAIASYIAFIQPKLVAGGDAFQSMTTLLQAARADESLVLDSSWDSKMEAALAAMRQNGQALQGYADPPAEVDRLNSLIVSLGKDMVYIADETQAGMDGMSDDHLSNATNRIDKMTETLNAITAEMKTLTPTN